ncbi:hypothetical protein, partial [Corynebacterium diphtheriae]|uniref:hypothetical protein n=1 Tax=Corynebacterium diphtheriae TaxID=1717 RepID=UPI001C4FAD84
EHLLCKQKVRSSILLCSTVWNPVGEAGFFLFCVSFFASSNSRLRKPQECCYAARVLSLGFRSLDLEFAVGEESQWETSISVLVLSVK